MVFGLCIAQLCIAKETIVCDAVDNKPIAGATIFNSSGVIVAITDDNGIAENLSPQDFPLSVRSLGYAASVFASPTDTLSLSPTNYSLGEVTVEAEGRPVTRVVGYVREYCSGSTPTDTIQMFSEYMVDIFTAAEKTKGFKRGDTTPRILKEMRYSRFANSVGVDSVARPTKDSEETMLSFMKVMLRLPTSTENETEKLANIESGTDTIAGKFWPRKILRKSPTLFSTTTDLLADYESHIWSPLFLKLLGMSVEMHKWTITSAYAIGNWNIHDINSYVAGEFSASLLCKGKWLKRAFHSERPVDVDIYIEFFPVDVTHLTLSDYKEIRDNDTWPGEIDRSTATTPVVPAIANLIERVESIPKNNPTDEIRQ